MRIATIICEYNPLHNGHKYHIDTTRKLTNCDCLLCIMSGNFAQRGEPTILDKYTRARHAIMSGADLVVELPPIFALSSAQFFANGAVKILAQLGDVTHLSFGSESGNIDELLQTADLTSSNEYNIAFREFMQSGLSYPRAASAAYSSIVGNENQWATPNNVLAIEYIRALKAFAPHIAPITIKRLGAGYHDNDFANIGFPSATAIRTSSASGIISSDGMPNYVYNSLLNPAKINTNRIFSIVADKLFCMPQCQLENLYEGDEGLANRLKKSLDCSIDYDSLLNATHTKRYTKSKIARLICHALLNHDKNMLENTVPILPLAVSKKHANYLGLLPKYDDDNAILLNIDYADHIYGIITGAVKQRRHIEIVQN